MISADATPVERIDEQIALACASGAFSYGGLCRSNLISITPMATNTAATMRSLYSHPVRTFADEGKSLNLEGWAGLLRLLAKV